MGAEGRPCQSPTCLSVCAWKLQFRLQTQQQKQEKIYLKTTGAFLTSLHLPPLSTDSESSVPVLLCAHNTNLSFVGNPDDVPSMCLGRRQHHTMSQHSSTKKDSVDSGGELLTQDEVQC